MSEISTVEPAYGLYPYQQQVVRDILNALSKPERRVVAHLPTGAGKTRVATHVACRLLNDGLGDQEIEHPLIIWLAASEELCEQAAEALEKAWENLGQGPVALHRFWGEYPLDLSDIHTGFLVTGLAKLYSASMSDGLHLVGLAAQAIGVIFDEAHQAIAETYSFVTEQICMRRPPLLGLTATPGRTYELSETDFRLAEMFGYSKVSIDPRGHSSVVAYLIRNGYLAQPIFRRIDLDSKVDVAEPREGTDYRRSDLEQLGNLSDRNFRLAELARDATRRHLRTIVFCPSVESALDCQQILHSDNTIADVIISGTPTDERRAIIEAFRGEGRERRILLNFGVLTAGFDAPRTSCVIVGRPTKSLVLYSQMVGRAMRGHQVGGNRRAEILTVVDTDLPGFGSVTEAFENWEDLWRK